MRALAAVLVLVLSGPAVAQSIRGTDYARVAKDVPVIDFEAPGLFLRVGGAHRAGAALFGESFAGLGVGEFRSPGGARFDRAAGTGANSPLTLLPGEPLFGLGLENRDGERGRVLVPDGPVGHGYFEGGGEGSLAILFDEDQCAFGARFELDLDERPEVLADGRRGLRVKLMFFDRQGQLLDQIHFDPPGRKLVWMAMGFRQSSDVPRIAGVYIENLDPAGIAFDDIVFRADCVPVVG